MDGLRSHLALLFRGHLGLRDKTTQKGAINMIGRNNSLNTRNSHLRAKLASFVERLEDRRLLATAPFFYGLGDLPGGPIGSAAKGISGDGQTIVGYSWGGPGSDDVEAVRWTLGTSGAPSMEPLGFLSNATVSSGRAASADGSIIVGHSKDGASESFRWIDGTNPTMVAIPDLPGDNGSGHGVAMDVSNDGTVIAGRTRSSDGLEAYVWRQDENDLHAPGQTIGLGDLPGGAFDSVALAISGDGSTAVGWGTNSENRMQAFRWEESESVMVALPDSGIESSAWDVSLDGSVVVGGDRLSEDVLRGKKVIAPATNEAYRWTEAGMVYLGDLEGGRHWSSAAAVSADGSVVAGSSETSIGQEAFVWDQVNGMRNLKDTLITDFGLGDDLAGWQLELVWDVTPDGLTFVGEGFNPNGDREAFIARITPPIPGINVTPDSGLQTSEDSSSPNHIDTFTVVLDAQPTNAVTINLSSSNTDEGVILGATTLVFDNTNWSVPQQVTIQGVDDLGQQDGNQPYLIQLDSSSSVDLNYAALSVVEITATNLDNDIPTPSNTIYVYDIQDAFDTRQRGRNKIDHRIVIDIREDENGIAEASDVGIGGVLVTVELRNSGGGLVGTYSGTTDSNGLFYSEWIRDLAPGDYRAEVTDLVLAGYDWDLLGLDPTFFDDDDDGDEKPDQLLSA